MTRLLTRRRFITGIIAAPAIAGLYTWQIEPTWVEFVRCELPIKNLPATLAGKTLVHLSDIHIGTKVSDGYLINTFNQVRDLSPDIVIHTGDLITYAGPETIDQAKRVLAHFPNGKLGTFACLGNHDYGDSFENGQVANSVAAALSETGCTVLRNQAANLQGLNILGFDDLWSGRFAPEEPLSKLGKDAAAIAPSHNPDSCDLPVWQNYQSWIFSGHTHGGQCKPPFLPPPLLPVRNKRYTSGEFSLTGGRQLYINRGLGHLLPVRFNVRPEVTVFRMTVV